MIQYFVLYVFFFFLITGSYSSRRGCFVWLTQKDTTICLQTYSELCKLIKKKPKNLLLMNAVCGMKALFLVQERQSGQRKYFFEIQNYHFEMFGN